MFSSECRQSWFIEYSIRSFVCGSDRDRLRFEL